jgi:glycosyltransferase involved in cell wall biosynthesis
LTVVNQKEQVTVCICTYKRPSFLKRLLEELVRQETGGLLDFSIVVVDNDSHESARQIVTDFATSSPIETSYCVEPISNIALARNKAVKSAKGDYLAFIDDDEVPLKDWLITLVKTCRNFGADGVLGPVKPHFEVTPPTWLTKAGFYNRPTHETGFVMSWQEARTGNVLIPRRILEGVEEIFRPEFGTGGEDQDFFRRMIDRGHTFIWCNEAPAYETVPPHRWERQFLLKRALLRGKATIRHPRNRIQNIVKSMIAVPLYGLALPFFLIVGQHVFMKYSVRLCDHLGRLLALIRLNPVNERCH